MFPLLGEDENRDFPSSSNSGLHGTAGREGVILHVRRWLVTDMGEISGRGKEGY